MSRSFDHFAPQGAGRGYYPRYSRFCSRRCDYCNPRLLWVRSRERQQVRREVEVDLVPLVPDTYEDAPTSWYEGGCDHSEGGICE